MTCENSGARHRAGASCAPGAADTLQGRWTLIAAEDLRADGSVARYPWALPSGRVDCGRERLVLSADHVERRPSLTTDRPVGDQMKATLLSSYIAYTGPCTGERREKEPSRSRSRPHGGPIT